MIKKIIRKMKLFLIAYHFLYAFFGALFYFFPSRKMKVIAVTGTNGKTTTVELITQTLKEAGFTVAAFSSIKFEIAGREEPNLFKMTMPGRATLQKLLRRAVNNGCEIAVIEVTSEGIRQHRHRFINIDTAIFTNLSPEHIESHGGFKNYRKEKRKLFFAAKDTHIINIDDENADYFLDVPSKRKICYGINFSSKILKKKKENSEIIRAKDIKILGKGVSFKVKEESFYLNLSGKFNVYNALAALAVCKKEGVKFEKAREAFRKVQTVPGRMEEVISSPFCVIVDYAVTPVTLESVYKEIRENISSKRVISVFGSCGGGRDKWKRPVLGEIAKKYCDKIILTNEDPYDEDPQEIIDDIEKGFFKNKNGSSQIPQYEKILDRRKAIKKALEVAEENDVIIITGKGSEPWMCVAGDKKISWDDRKIIKEEAKKLGILINEEKT